VGFAEINEATPHLELFRKAYGTEVKRRTVFLVTGARENILSLKSERRMGPWERPFWQGPLPVVEALPVILTDVEQVDALKLILQSVGLTITDLRKGEKDLKLSENRILQS